MSLFDAVLDLKRCLQVAGSDLVIRKGRSKDVLLALAQEVSKGVFFMIGDMFLLVFFFCAIRDLCHQFQALCVSGRVSWNLIHVHKFW
jgi:hypothetical protein